MLWPTLPSMPRSPLRAAAAVAFLALALRVATPPLGAASTGQTALYTPQGSAAGTGNGDYVTATGGLNTFYRYFIEVPQGLGHLVVEIFDADVGRGGTAEATAGRDRDRDGGGFNTTATYTLLRPDGTTAVTLACTAATCTDNGWQALLDSTTAQNTAAGHWELRVAMSGSTNVNAIGIRAHDGTSGAGGTELNVYYDSQNQFGVNPPASGAGTRSYAVYPYVTSGCSAGKNDFDYDSNNGNTGSVNLTSRTGAFTQNYASTSLSTTNTWRRDTFSGWTSDTSSADYGIWSAAITINTYTAGGAVNGNYANVYFSNFQAAANPPTANPTPNAFRVYLPTDAGTAPAKPYVEQLATYSGCGAGNDGPNPPVVGQTSCYTVTVEVVNPAAQAITFSAANLVTANVPGGGTVYAGLAQTSQGTITAQPAVGGTGNVTWNPGTVAAGATAVLAYRVKVTPAAAGQRLPLTATPASGNGTRAQYVDTTGNTTQARATFLFGPLCELAVTQGLLTEAVVSSFHASAAAGGGVLVEWRTASEAGTAGFYLHRWNGQEWEPVHRELLAGLIHEPQGGVYRYLDGGASPREPQVYLLEEVEVSGRRRTHGPFAVQVDWSRDRSGRETRELAAEYEREAHAATGRGAATPAGRRKDLIPDPPGKPGASSAGVHLAVRGTGLHYLRSADVAAWFGMPQPLAAVMIGEGGLALSRDGQPVAWMPDVVAGPGPLKQAQGLFFYGQAAGGLYSAAGVYRLERKPGRLMTVMPAGPAPAGAAAAAFPETLHVERDVFAATLISPDPESDYWFWEFLQGDDPAYGHRTFALDAPGLAAGQAGTLTVSLYGATDSGVAGEHRAVVAVNGTALGDTSWQGIAAWQASFPIPPGVLQAAGNQVEITAHTGAGAPYSIYYLNGFDLAYPRTFQAAGDALAFSAAGTAKVTVTGFTNPGIRLLDVADPLQPRWLSGATVEADGAGGWRLTFAPAGPGPFLAAAPAALQAPAEPRAWSAPSPSLRSPVNRAAYLVIAPASLHVAAERLASLRRAQGLEARVVDLEAIFDEFAFGVPNPHAIHDFLALAWQSWSLRPRYVALAGAGTLDYRDLLGFGDDLVPPLLIRTPSGLFPSDNLLGDVDGDGLPEMAVGRLPVLSAAELEAYTAKLAVFEAAAPAGWNGNALFLADAADRGADFAADSAGVAAQLPAGYTVQRLDLTSTPLAAARAQVQDGFANGVAFVDYLGHGALDRLAAGGLLTNDDVPGLANGERLPVLTAMTCTINRFELPGIPALGELLVKRGGGGAAAVWGPSGLSAHGDARLLATRFYHAADERLGDRVRRAIAELRALGGDPDLPRIYELLGDPALRLKAPPAPPPAPAGRGE